MKLLCTADIHLGRQPSRIPEALAGIKADLTPAAVWRGTVDIALAEEVDAVLIAGDVVEQNDDFYEAYPELRTGVDRLAAANIKVLGVVGNHDVHVLPRLADAVPGFTLLGRAGTWERVTVVGKDGTDVDILGWSYPHDVVTTSPLASLGTVAKRRTTIGLLHCDRDQSGSRYAPVASADLRNANLDAWLLGHVHKPDIADGPQPIGYLGSPIGVDPGETGPHGPWILDVAPDGRLELTHLPLSPLHWLDLTIDISSVTHANDVERLILDAIEHEQETFARAAYRPRVIGCRVRLVGRTDIAAALRRALDADDPTTSIIPAGDASYFIHALHREFRPNVDLVELAHGTDPVGLLARKLLVLADPSHPGWAGLIADGRERLERTMQSRSFKQLGDPAPDDDTTMRYLQVAGFEVLERLLQQRKEST